MNDSSLSAGQLDIADRVVGTLVSGFVVAQALPAETPDNLEFAISDFCFHQGGVTDDAVLLFERMRPGPARLVLDWYSSDYTLTTSPFEFQFTVK